MKRAPEFLDQKVDRGVGIFVVTGEESFFREQAVAHIRSAYPTEVEFDCLEADALKSEGGLAALLDDLRTRSLFGGDRLLHVRQVDTLEAEATKALARFLAAQEAVHPLILEGRGLMAPRRKEAPKTGLVGTIAKAGGVIVSCDPLYDSPFQGRGPAWQSPLSRWVQGRASHYGKKMSLQVAFLLHRSVGTGLRELDGELSKLALFVKDRPGISETDVEEVVGGTRLLPVFELSEAVADGDLKKALELSELLFVRGSADASGRRVHDPNSLAMMLLGATTSRLRKVGRVVELMASGTEFQEAARAAQQNPLFMDRLRAQCETWRRSGGLKNLLHSLRELDRELKSGGGEPRVLIETCLVRALKGPLEGRGMAWSR